MPQPRTYVSAADRQAAYRARCKNERQRELAAKGLPPLPGLPAIPGTTRWKAAIKQAQCLLTAVREEMQTYHDNRSDAWQESQRAEEFLQKQEQVDELLDGVNQILQEWQTP